MFLFLILILNFSFFLFKEKISNLYFLCENYKGFLIKHQKEYKALNKKYEIIYRLRYNFYSCLKNKNISFCCKNIAFSNVKTTYDDVLDICIVNLVDFSEEFVLR